MSVRCRATLCFSVLLSPAGFVIGYALSLYAVAAGVVAFPSSSTMRGLLVVLVGAFFVVTIPVTVMASLFITTAVSRALMGPARRRLFCPGSDSGKHRATKPCPFHKDVEPQATDAGLWDRWIDGL